WAPLGMATVLTSTFALAQAAGVPNHRLQTAKFAFPFAGLFTITAARGLATIGRRRPRLAASATAVILAGAALSTRQLARKGETMYPPYALPWPEVAAEIERRAGTDDAVVTADGPLLYYLARSVQTPPGFAS